MKKNTKLRIDFSEIIWWNGDFFVILHSICGTSLKVRQKDAIAGRYETVMGINPKVKFL